MTPVMNNTKWNELRLAMYNIEPSPKWVTLADNGHTSEPDREWFYHFRAGGYQDIVHVDILADDDAHSERIKAALQRINLPGIRIENGFRIYGYVKVGAQVDYI